MTNSFTHMMVKDGEEYELEVEYEYPAGRDAGLSVNIEQVVQIKTEADIDTEMYTEKLTQEEIDSLEQACKDHQHALEMHEESKQGRSYP